MILIRLVTASLALVTVLALGSSASAARVIGDAVVCISMPLGLGGD